MTLKYKTIIYEKLTVVKFGMQYVLFFTLCWSADLYLKEMQNVQF